MADLICGLAQSSGQKQGIMTIRCDIRLSSAEMCKLNVELS